MTTKALNSCKMAPGSSVSAHVLKMKGYIDTLDKLGAPISRELAIDLVLASLPSDYDQFFMNFNMHGMEKTLDELHGMLKNAEQSIKKATPVLVVQKAKGAKGKAKPKPKNKVGPYTKGKVAYTSKGERVRPPTKPKSQKEGVCFHCNEPGHWKRNCPLYLEEIKKNGSKASASGIFLIEIKLSISTSWVLDIGCGSHICANVQATK